MKRRILLAMLGLLLVAAGVWTGFTLYWRGRYEAEIERIRAAGHPVLPEDVVVPECPDDENMLPLLKRAEDKFEALVEENLELNLRGFDLFDPDREDGVVTEAQARAALEVLGPYFAQIELATGRPRLVMGRNALDGCLALTDLPGRLRVRAHLYPETALQGSQALLRMASGMEPTSWAQAYYRGAWTTVGIELLRGDIERGGRPDDALNAKSPRPWGRRLSAWVREMEKSESSCRSYATRGFS